MTQTAHKVKHHLNGATVTVFAKDNHHAKKRFAFDVEVNRISVREALEYHLEELLHADPDYSVMPSNQEAIVYIASCARDGYLWQVTGGIRRDNSYQDLQYDYLQEFHATKKAAIEQALSEDC